MAPPSLDAIAALLRTRGQRRYTGEPVSHLEHALQTAHLAEQSQADDALVCACLLHDLGHLLTDSEASPVDEGVNDRHEARALPLLKGLFPPVVLQGIGLHVEAKRYLCFAEPAYRERMSEDSQRSLMLQGGAFDARQAARFLARPGAAQALRLRVWDDLAKQPGLATPPLGHFIERARRLL